MTREEILVIENLTKKFSNFTALDKLNLKINAGSCVGFLGPNGAGKSTTIKILTGLLKPSSGQAYINGFEISKDLRSALFNVGAIVETPEFSSYFTPQETLTYFGKLRGMSGQNLYERIKHVLQMVNLQDWTHKKIGKFSKGMKQRVAIASTLLHDPSLIIFDEPTSGLDPRGMIEIRQVINSLKKEGKTIFMSTHLLRETQQICDMVALLDKGKLLLYDKVKAISNISNKSKILIEVLEHISSSQLSLVEKISDVKSVTLQDSSNLIVEFGGGFDQRAELLKNIQNCGLNIITFKALDSDLESLYMELVSNSIR